ncbi:DUF3662 and FHA domain-containing protein [Nocardioidaceae bacterium]|nr:DUF3662 and FHA domain-containing protein [Nocardioidaceae bacterium]
MGVLQRFEDRLEEIVAGTFARAFRSAVQPVELAAALQRECDRSSQALSRQRRLVPNAFRVQLSPYDHERLAEYTDALSDELADMLKDYAEEQRYVFAGPLVIDFETAEEFGTGRFRVLSKAVASVSAASGSSRGPEPGRRGTRLVLEVNGERVPLEPPGVVVGRGSDATLRINDPSISRRHVEFQVAGGRGTPDVHVEDLGSTNGMRVDGHDVSRARLTDGSEVRIGNTTLVLHVVRREDRDRYEEDAQ